MERLHIVDFKSPKFQPILLLLGVPEEVQNLEKDPDIAIDSGITCIGGCSCVA